MYHFGVGVPRDAPAARRYYRRCYDLDPSGVQSPVSMMLALLAAQVYLVDIPPVQDIMETMLWDFRTHLLAIHILLLAVLMYARALLLLGLAAREAREEGRSPDTDT